MYITNVYGRDKVVKEMFGRGFWTRFMILLLLKKGCSYGYEIATEISKILPFDFKNKKGGMGPIYAFLRKMESDGLIVSKWDVNSTGPAKRNYCLTEEGEELIRIWINEVKNLKNIISKVCEFAEKVVENDGCVSNL